MDKLSLRALISIWLLLGLLAPVMLCADDAENLLANPGFESPQEPGALPEGWGWFTSDKRKMGVSDEEAHSGAQSLKVSAQNIDDAQLGVLQEIAVEPGERYEFTAEILNADQDRMRGNLWGSIDVEWLDANGNEIARETGEYWKRTTSKMHWKDYELDTKAPDGARRARFVIRVMDGRPHGSGSFYIDDVTLEKD
jgi:hypothetical protein